MPSQNLLMFSIFLLPYCYIYYSYTLYLSGAQMSLAIRCCGTGLAICPVMSLWCLVKTCLCFPSFVTILFHLLLLYTVLVRCSDEFGYKRCCGTGLAICPVMLSNDLR